MVHFQHLSTYWHTQYYEINKRYVVLYYCDLFLSLSKIFYNDRLLFEQHTNATLTDNYTRLHWRNTVRMRHQPAKSNQTLPFLELYSPTAHPESCPENRVGKRYQEWARAVNFKITITHQGCIFCTKGLFLLLALTDTTIVNFPGCTKNAWAAVAFIACESTFAFGRQQKNPI